MIEQNPDSPRPHTVEGQHPLLQRVRNIVTGILHPNDTRKRSFEAGIFAAGNGPLVFDTAEFDSTTEVQAVQNFERGGLYTVHVKGLERAMESSWLTHFEGRVPMSWTNWIAARDDIQEASSRHIQLSKDLVNAGVTYPCGFFVLEAVIESQRLSRPQVQIAVEMLRIENELSYAFGSFRRLQDLIDQLKKHQRKLNVPEETLAYADRMMARLVANTPNKMVIPTDRGDVLERPSPSTDISKDHYKYPSMLATYNDCLRHLLQPEEARS